MLINQKLVKNEWITCLYLKILIKKKLYTHIYLMSLPYAISKKKKIKDDNSSNSLKPFFFITHTET